MVNARSGCAHLEHPSEGFIAKETPPPPLPRTQSSGTLWACSANFAGQSQVPILGLQEDGFFSLPEEAVRVFNKMPSPGLVSTRRRWMNLSVLSACAGLAVRCSIAWKLDSWLYSKQRDLWFSVVALRKAPGVIGCHANRLRIAGLDGLLYRRKSRGRDEAFHGD